MFGYIVVNQPELKIKEYDEYRRFYCGLCKSLKDRHGATGQLSLSYDMTFLCILLTQLYEPESVRGMRRCIAHPTGKHGYITNLYTDYVADMNVLLTYYKCMDDWEDERKLSRKLYAGALISRKSPLHETYADKIQVITESLDRIHELEEEGSSELDELSGAFGRAMAEICAPHHDEWEEYLRSIGYYLGKFIYIVDAYDDIEKDIGAANFNPFVNRLAKSRGVDVQSVGTKEQITEAEWRELADFTQDALLMMAAPLAKSFEMLPIVEDVGILRNIIYSGIWEAYYTATNRRCGETPIAKTDAPQDAQYDGDEQS